MVVAQLVLSCSENVDCIFHRIGALNCNLEIWYGFICSLNAMSFTLEIICWLRIYYFQLLSMRLAVLCLNLLNLHKDCISLFFFIFFVFFFLFVRVNGMLRNVFFKQSMCVFIFFSFFCIMTKEKHRLHYIGFAST